VTPEQSILIVFGVLNLAFATIAGYFLYWDRVRDVSDAPPRFALITHTSAMTSGLILLALSVAIEFTGFTSSINVGLALLAVAASIGSAIRNMYSWRLRHEDGMADIAIWQRRLRGAVNVLNLVVMWAVLYGVTRTALGI
jgi:hypothetical protein